MSNGSRANSYLLSIEECRSSSLRMTKGQVDRPEATMLVSRFRIFSAHWSGVPSRPRCPECSRLSRSR